MIKPHSRVGFILNTDKKDKPGQHWVAVFADGRPNGSQSIEYYNSFADDIPNDIREDLKKVGDKISPDNLLKLKVNYVKQQAERSENCGHFCIRFLVDRFHGKSFADATGYDQGLKTSAVTKNESEIENL